MAGYLDAIAPEGLRTRGTLLVLPGRGESADTYRRFSSRLAADAYRVRVIETGAAGTDPGHFCLSATAIPSPTAPHSTA